MPVITEKSMEYLNRVERLHEACVDQNSQLWLESHPDNINKFRKSMDAWIYPNTQGVSPETKYKGSLYSGISKASVTSAKLKLMEQKAKTEAKN